jgi:hypothetical protein
MRNDKLTAVEPNCTKEQTSTLTAPKSLVMGRNAGLLAAVCLLFTLTACTDLSVPDPDQVS